MSVELTTLTSCYKGHPTLPRGVGLVAIWLSFKKLVLEDEERREFLKQSPVMDLEAFTTWWRQSVPDSSLPKIFKDRHVGKRRYARFHELLRGCHRHYLDVLAPTADKLFVVRPCKRHGGLGVYARQNILLAASIAAPSIVYGEQLSGTLHHVPQKAADALKRTYPSLLTCCGKPAVFTGMLALVNHRCGSDTHCLSFSPLPRENCVHNRGSHPVQLQYIGPEMKIRTASQLTANYIPGKSTSCFQPCLCMSCRPSKRHLH
jgi:hypothetical protein